MGIKREIDEDMDLKLCRSVTQGKPGDLVLWRGGSRASGDAGELLRVSGSQVAADWQGEGMAVSGTADVVLAPVCWVGGKPAYVGDELEHNIAGSVTLTGPFIDGSVAIQTVTGPGSSFLKNLSWPKTEFVLRLALFNDGNSRILDKGEPDPNEAEVRIISWEA